MRVSIADAAYEADERLAQLLLAEARIKRARQAASIACTSDHQYVVVLAVAGDADFGSRGTRASVGTSGHSNHHIDAAETFALECRQVTRQRVFRVRHREAAGRLGRARHREFTQWCDAISERHPALSERALDELAPGLWNMHQNQMLIGCDAHADAVDRGDNLANRTAIADRGGIGYTPEWDQDARIQMMSLAGFRIPSEVVTHRRKLRLVAVVQRDAEVIAQLAFHALEAQPPDRIFPSRGAAILSLTVFLLHRHDRADGIDELGARDAAQMKREQWHRRGIVVSHAHPAAAVKFEAATVADHRHETDIVGEQIDAVVVRMCEADLEFARQILRAIDRLFRVKRRNLMSLFIGQKHLIVGRGARREFARDLMR